MSEHTSVEPSEFHHDVPAGHDVCPVCGRESGGGLAAVGQLSDELRRLIAANAPGGNLTRHVCPRCMRLFERAHVQLEKYSVVFEQGRYVLPTYLRLDADARFTGRGVTIAFLDSGFYSHPDLVTPESRILVYHNITPHGTGTLQSTETANWHGMMTSVVAAGNGHLSGGFFRGIAPDARLVLVKVSTSGHIPERNIKDGLEWVLKHRRKYGIRIVNISAGGDGEESYLTNPLCQVVERAVREGLVVVCAAGNAGMEPGHPVIPPASSPSSVAVGGRAAPNTPPRPRPGLVPTADRPPCIFAFTPLRAEAPTGA